MEGGKLFMNFSEDFFHWLVIFFVRPQRQTKRLFVNRMVIVEKIGNALVHAFLAVAFSLLLTSISAADQPREQGFNIPQQSVQSALNSLASQANMFLLFPYDDVIEVEANPVMGTYSVQHALNILLHNTGLKGDLTEGGVIAISQAGIGASSITDISKGKSMNTNARKTVLASMVGLFAAGGMATATAQDSVGESARAQGVLDEIIVTSTRRAESLNDAALSVAAIGGEEIDKRNLAEMNDYLRSIPGVAYVDMGVGRNTVIVRGLSIDPEIEASLSGTTVGVYFGEVSLGGLSALGGNADIKMIDLDRVEVLRGPQGTLFGSGSLGGAVRNIPNAPNLEEFEGAIKTTFSDTSGNGGENTKIEGVINIPLIENELAIRAVAYRHDNSGYINNIAGTQLAIDGPVAATYTAQDAVDTYGGAELYRDERGIGDADYTGGRLSVLWQPNEDFSATLHYLNQDAKQKGWPYVQINTGGFNQVALQVNVPELNGEGEGLKDDITISNLVLEYDLGWASILSSSVFLEDDSEYRYDITHFFSGSPAFQTVALTHEAFTQEFRLVSNLEGSLQYIAGIYYEDIDSDNFALTYSTGDLSRTLFGTPLVDGDPLIDILTEDFSLEQLSFYGELSYDITEKFKASVGFRRFDYDRFKRTIGRGAFGFKDEPSEFSESGTSGKVNFAYQLSDDALMYLQWSEGFRLGGTNFILPKSLCDVNDDGLLDGTTAAIKPGFDSDSTENVEFGVKLTMLESRLQVNAAVYDINWENIPIRVFPGKLPEQDEQICFSSTTVNVAEAQSRGIELESTYQLSPQLSLNIGGSYTEVELARDVSVLGSSKGDRLPGTPEYNVSFGFNYEFELAEYPAYFRTDYAYVSDSYNMIAEQGNRAGDYTEINLISGVTLGNFTVDVFAFNVTDENSYTSSTAVFPDTRAFRLRPRTIGVNLGYQF
ncbi:TonB-dependent receptor domain-containing protein [SAR92 clade bacterium H246]